MALINCPECGKQVSDVASSCPNCGYPISHYIETMQESNNANTFFQENKSEKKDIAVSDSTEEARKHLSKDAKTIKKKRIISRPIGYFLIAMVIFSIAIILYINGTAPKRNLSNNIKNYCNEAGLNEVDVTLEQLDNKNYVSYTAEIKSDDFSNLKENEMLDFFKNLSTIEDNHKFFIYTKTVVNCNNDIYTFTPEVQSQKTPLTVIKNGEILYEAELPLPRFNTTPKSQMSSTTKPNATQKTEDSKEKKRQLDAWVCAEDIVQNNLKSPSTAKFCKYPEATITYSGDSSWVVSGWVDAQNSYGATVRTRFLVTLTLTENGYKNGYVIFDE